jgi:hypothetical protein
MHLSNTSKEKNISISRLKDLEEIKWELKKHLLAGCRKRDDVNIYIFLAYFYKKKASSLGQNCSILSQKVPKFELYKHNDELFNIYSGIFYELCTFAYFD